MKKLSSFLLGSFLLYLLTNYIFLKGGSEPSEFVNSSSNAVDIDKARVLTILASQDAFASGSNSMFNIKNNTEYACIVKMIKKPENIEYMIFHLPKNYSDEKNVLPGEYNLKVKYFDGKKFSYHEESVNCMDDALTTVSIYGNDVSSLIKQSSDISKSITRSQYYK